MSIPIAKWNPAWWLGVWSLVNLLTAALSPIDADEAYYWMYAQHLDWGYFDHPPVVALLIKTGMDWLPGALGLRFGHVLAGGVTAWVLFRLVGSPRGREGWLAALLIASLPMLEVYGFIATPDGPLLLFSALLIWRYRYFLETPSFRNGLWLSLIMTALLYSKYHGVLLILFLILPQLPWLVRQPAAWVSVALGAVLYIPHLYWQYAHDFPSFRYHLSGRNDPYQFKYTTEYLLNQLLIFNPFLLYFYFRSLRKPKHLIGGNSTDYRFVSSLRWLVFLTLGFFLYSTSKGGTEAQWTAMLTVPLFYLLWRGYRNHPEWRPWLTRAAYVSVGIFILARLLLIAPREWVPFRKPFDAAPWVAEIAALAEHRPVIFENSYRDASHYRFYTGNAPAWTFTDVDYRPNQYDIWTGDTAYHNREVLLVGKDRWTLSGTTPYRNYRKNLNYKIIPGWQAADNWKLCLNAPPRDTLERGRPLPVELFISTSRGAISPPTPVCVAQPGRPKGGVQDSNFNSGATLRFDTELSLQLYAIYQYVGDGWRYYPLSPLQSRAVEEGPGETLLYRGEIPVPDDLPPGDVVFQLGLGYEGMPPLRGQSELWPVFIR